MDIQSAYDNWSDSYDTDLNLTRDLDQEVTGKALGKHFTLASLRKKGFKAIFLGVGAQKGKRLGIPGEDAEGVVDALEFLDGLREGAEHPGRVARRVVDAGADDRHLGHRRIRRDLTEAELPDERLQDPLGLGQLDPGNGQFQSLLEALNKRK